MKSVLELFEKSTDFGKGKLYKSLINPIDIKNDNIMNKNIFDISCLFD